MISPISTPPVAAPPVNPMAAVDRAAVQGAERFTSGVAATNGPAVDATASAPATKGVDSAKLADMLNLKGPFQGVRQGLDRVMQLRNEYQGKIKTGEMKPTSPEAEDFRGRMNEEMLRLQIEAGQAQFSVQLAAKVIEHGTSATKNIMQTQI